MRAHSAKITVNYSSIFSILDFNILARIKRDCDDLYYVEHNTEQILAEINEKPKVTDNN